MGMHSTMQPQKSMGFGELSMGQPVGSATMKGRIGPKPGQPDILVEEKSDGGLGELVGGMLKTARK